MNAIQFSVIGFGRIGQRHAKIIQEYSHSELVSVVDVNTKQFDSINSLGLDCITYESIVVFLDEDKGNSEIVTIATPNGFHAEYAIKLLEHGYHVLIEKPMALSEEEAKLIIKAEKESNKKVFVVKQNRYSPPSVWMRNMVESGLIGDTLMVQVNCYWNRDARYYKVSDWKGTKDLDGGALFTQFSHFVDIMYWVFGDIKEPKAIVKNYTHSDLVDFDDSGFAQFEFENGGMGSINYSTSCWDKNMESSITIVGTKGSFKVGGQYMNEVEYCHIQGYEMPELPATNPPNDYGPYKGSAANHHYVFENIVDVLNGKEEPMATSFDGMKVVSIIERIYKSAGFTK
ncbi:MAG: gfo/Idh/MocA family oxidoreductase [Balneola sp.]|nr:MAG: gfo/Idh/MocA family oxidoreductase [Balneola sp.]